jgi:hypothetical protein
MFEQALLVPRDKAYFQPAEGKFIPLQDGVPDILKTPHIRRRFGTLEGLESGYRSGLVVIDGKMYKLKACRPTGGDLNGIPWGSQVYSAARRGADQLLRRREMFLREGFEYPANPLGFWQYKDFRYRGQPQTGIIYEIEGDTRFDELIAWVVEAPLSYASYKQFLPFKLVTENLACQAGILLSLMHHHDFSWDHDAPDSSNAHAGNIVVFRSKQNTALAALIDFDNSLDFTDRKTKGSKLKRRNAFMQDEQTLESNIKSNTVISTADKRRVEPDKMAIYNLGPIVTTVMESCSDAERSIVEKYLLDELKDSASNFSRATLAAEVIMGQYYHRRTPLPWSLATDLAELRGELLIDFLRNATSTLARDKTNLVKRAQSKYFLLGYPHQTVVTEAFKTSPDQINVEETDNAESLSKITSILDQIQKIIDPQPTDPKFFSVKDLDDNQLNQISNLDLANVKYFAENWVLGDLQTAFLDKYSPKTVGTFLLYLSQIKGWELIQSLDLLYSSAKILEPHSWTKAAHFMSVLPPGIMRGSHLEEFKESLSSDFFVQAGLDLFALGIVTPEIREILRKRNWQIILNSFNQSHIQSLQAAVHFPLEFVDKVDQTKRITASSLAALASSYVNCLKEEDLETLDCLNEEDTTAVAMALNYWYADKPLSQINSPWVESLLTIELNSKQLTTILCQVLQSQISPNPDSALIANIKKTQINAQDLIEIVFTVLDKAEGDLNKADPSIMEALAGKTFEGDVKVTDLSNLVYRCIEYGIDIPEIVRDQIEKASDFHQVVDIFSSDVKGYVENPVFATLVCGFEVLPKTIKELIANTPKKKLAKSWAFSLLVHIFQNGFYKHYYSGLGFAEGYPQPKKSQEEIKDKQGNLQLWRLIHPDIWNLLKKAGQYIVVGYVDNLPETNLEIRYTDSVFAEDQTLTCSYKDVLPPNFHKYLK